MPHPQAYFLQQLATHTEHGLMFLALSMARSKDFSGLHAVLDAIEPNPGYLFTKNAIVNTVNGKDASVRFSNVFAEALAPGAHGLWSTEQEAFFAQLMPMIEGTGMQNLLVKELIDQNVKSPSLIMAMVSSSSMALESCLNAATKSGNLFMVSALSVHASSSAMTTAFWDLNIDKCVDFRVPINDDSASPFQLAAPMLEAFIEQYHASEEGKVELRVLTAQIERLMGHDVCERFRLLLLAECLSHAVSISQPVDIHVLADVMGMPGATLDQTPLAEIFQNTLHRPGFSDLQMDIYGQSLDPSVYLAHTALSHHCRPLLELAWPLFSNKTFDPMARAISTLYFSTAAGFEATVLFLEEKAAKKHAMAEKPVNTLADFLKRKLSGSDVAQTQEPVRVATSLFHLGGTSEPDSSDWEEKMLVLIKCGADPLAKNRHGQTAADLIAPGYGEMKEKWNDIVRSLSARKQLRSLLDEMEADTPKTVPDCRRA